MHPIVTWHDLGPAPLSPPWCDSYLRVTEYLSIIATGQLEYARNNANSARAAGQWARTKHHAPAADFTTDELSPICTRCRSSASVYGEDDTTLDTPGHFTAATATGRPDRQTDEMESNKVGARQAAPYLGDCSDMKMGEIAKSVGTTPMGSGTESATAAVGHELVAWEMLGAAVRTLEAVGHIGADVVRQASEARHAGGAARHNVGMRRSSVSH